MMFGTVKNRGPWLVLVLVLGTTHAAIPQTAKINLGDAKLWEVETGKVLADFKGFETEATAIAFSGDGSKVAVVGWERISVFEAKTGRELFTEKKLNQSWNVLAFSPDGNHLVVGGMHGVYNSYDLKSCKTKTYYWDRSWEWNFTAMAFSLDGKTLIIAGGTVRSKPGKIEFIDLATRKSTGALNFPNRVMWMALSPDGKFLASANDTQTPDGKLLAPALDMGVQVFDWKTKKKQYMLKGFVPLAFSGDSKLLATCKPFIEENVKVLTWDMESGKQKGSIELDSRQCPEALSLSPNGKIVATGERFGPLVKLWDTETGKFIRKLEGFKGGIVRSMAFSPDGKWLAAAGWHSYTPNKSEKK